MNAKSKTALSFAIVGTTALLDQLTKSIARSHIKFGDSKSVVPGLFDLTHLHNPGAAFGILGGMSPSLRIVLFLLIYALVAFFALSRIRATTSKLEIVALSFLMGGAIGNAIDRFQNGFVTDFLDFYFASYHYPAFNLADIAICTAVTALLLNEYLDKRRRAR